MSKARILVVDDEAIVRISCERILKPKGYEILTADNAQAGLDMLDREKIDLVLTDLKMPGMDGLEFLKSVKSKCPQVAVVMVTGYSTIDTAVKSIKLGAYDYLNKPFTPDQLTEVVQKALSNIQSE